jgi:alpha-glucoside transport system permease protein
MWDVFVSLGIMVAGAAGFILIFVALYALGSLFTGKWKERVHILPFAGPAMFLVFAGLFVSTVRTIVASFLDDIGKESVGWDNYKEIFSDTELRLTVANSVVWVIVGTFLTVFIGLVIARFADGMKGEKLAKSLIFVPTAISLVGTGIIWKFVYDGPPFQLGLLNQVTKGAGGIGLPASLGGKGDRLWLLERGYGVLKPPGGSWPGINTFLLIIVFMWAQAGIATVILSAAIKGVPQELLEAARIDGATNSQIFRKVSIPYIKGTIMTVTTLTMLGALKGFGLIAAATGGRFGTSNMANELFFKLFVQFRDGLGSALAVLLFVLCFPVLLLNRVVQKRVAETQ